MNRAAEIEECPCIQPLLHKREGLWYISFPWNEFTYIDRLGIDKYSFQYEKEVQEEDEGGNVSKRKIIYLAYPYDYAIKTLGMKIYDEPQKYNDDYYIVVQFKELDSIDQVKEYITNEHFVFAGCRSPVDTSGVHIKCDKKEIYVTWHPFIEWYENHVDILSINQGLG